MIVISDCLNGKVDEGCLKVAYTLTKKLKEKYDDTVVVSYKEKSAISDVHFELNSLFCNSVLKNFLNEKKDDVLYIPFASNTFGSALRIFVLSVFNKKDVYTIFSLQHKMNFITKLLLKLSKVKIIALSSESYKFYDNVCKGKVLYFKTGVDTEKFIPVDDEKKKTLKIKYGLDPEMPVVLHVGHLNKGRNLIEFTKVSDKYHSVIVLSTLTTEQQDSALKQELSEKGNVKFLEEYYENIEEIYQMSDVYFFPVSEKESCIDVPLSVLEAASCNIPIVCTRYGELSEFKNSSGFYFLNDFTEKTINDSIEKAISSKYDVRDSIKDYDWNMSLDFFK